MKKLKTYLSENLNRSEKKVAKIIFNYIKSVNKKFKKSGRLDDISSYIEEAEGDYDSIVDDLMARLVMNYDINDSDAQDIEGFILSALDEI